MDIEVNYLAVLVSGIAAMVVGYVWYGTLFRQMWSKEMEFDKIDPQKKEAMMKGMGLAYFQQFIGALLMAYVFDHVLWAFEPGSLGVALQGALWTWLGFVVPVKYADKLWGGKSMKLFLIDSVHYLVTLLVFAAILFSWK